jgi:ABC-type lipoprotein export system ATPase subunit
MSVEEQKRGIVGAVAAYTLEFNDVSYFVKLKGGKTKQILHNVSGTCVSGRLMALMGPSGAGKTSLVSTVPLIQQYLADLCMAHGHDLATAFNQTYDVVS